MSIERRMNRALLKKAGKLKKPAAPGTFDKHILFERVNPVTGRMEHLHATKGFRSYRKVGN